jgi:hypothetical protein
MKINLHTVHTIKTALLGMCSQCFDAYFSNQPLTCEQCGGELEQALRTIPPTPSRITRYPDDQSSDNPEYIVEARKLFLAGQDERLPDGRTPSPLTAFWRAEHEQRAATLVWMERGGHRMGVPKPKINWDEEPVRGEEERAAPLGLTLIRLTNLEEQLEEFRWFMHSWLLDIAMHPYTKTHDGYWGPSDAFLAYLDSEFDEPSRWKGGEDPSTISPALYGLLEGGLNELYREDPQASLVLDAAIFQPRRRPVEAPPLTLSDVARHLGITDSNSTRTVRRALRRGIRWMVERNRPTAKAVERPTFQLHEDERWYPQGQSWDMYWQLERAWELNGKGSGRIRNRDFFSLDYANGLDKSAEEIRGAKAAWVSSKVAGANGDEEPDHGDEGWNKASFHVAEHWGEPYTVPPSQRSLSVSEEVALILWSLPEYVIEAKATSVEEAERNAAVYDLVWRLCWLSERPVRRVEIVEAGAAEGLSRTTIDRALKDILERGRITSPKYGYYLAGDINTIKVKIEGEGPKQRTWVWDRTHIWVIEWGHAWALHNGELFNMEWGRLRPPGTYRTKCVYYELQHSLNFLTDLSVDVEDEPLVYGGAVQAVG